MKARTRWFLILLVVLVLLLVPGVLRVYSIGGASDAPTFVIGDRVLVNRMAYDAVVPYAHTRLFTWGHPRRGDMVLLRLPDRDGHPASKRVVGVPGDRVEMREHRLYVNGEPMQYERLDSADFSWIPAENRLGAVVELERGLGADHPITHDAELAVLASFDPVQLEDGEYYVLGDNRADSHDSRAFGPVPRDHIQGKVMRLLIPGPERP